MKPPRKFPMNRETLRIVSQIDLHTKNIRNLAASKKGVSLADLQENLARIRFACDEVDRLATIESKDFVRDDVNIPQTTVV